MKLLEIAYLERKKQLRRKKGFEQNEAIKQIVQAEEDNLDKEWENIKKLTQEKTK